MDELERDARVLTLLDEPASEPQGSREPGLLADFEGVKSRTIAGAPPVADGAK